MRKIILGGSLFVLFIYLIWEVLVLGIVPLDGPHGLIQTFKLDQEGAQALTSILKSPWITLFAEGLAFFAILTSFLAQALSLVHFLADGLKVADKKREPIGLCLLVLIPPLLLSLIWPKLFFKALNFAGGFCAIVLFGILPALMVWIGRYRKKTTSPYTVPGGKALLIFVFAFACFTFLFQLLCSLDILSLAKAGLHE